MLGRRAHGTSPYETTIGFSRAVRVGSMTAVSGTAPVGTDGETVPGDVTVQARRCFEIIREALLDVGVPLRDVIRTRMYIIDPRDASAVGAVHAEVFGEIRPAATMVVVAGLLRADWAVEIEADAYSPDLS